MSKIGVHVFIGARKGYGEFLKKIADAGQTLALVKCLDDFGAAKEAKDLMPKTVTMGRLNQGQGEDGRSFDAGAIDPLKPDGTYKDPREIAERYYAAVKPKWKLNPWIDIWETFNEFSAHWGWQSDFYLAMMDLAEPDGFKLAHYACSTGNPPPDVVEQILPCLKAAKRRGHYLTTHEYGGVGMPVETLKGTQPYHALRYRELYETILIPNDADPPLIISECGQSSGANFVGTETFIADYTWYDAELMQDGYVVGAAAWSLGKIPMWGDTSLAEALPAFADYIVAHPTTTPQPAKVRTDSVVYKPIGSAPPGGGGQPPVTGSTPVIETPPAKPKPRGAPRAQYTRIYLLLPNEPATPDGQARIGEWLQAVAASGVLTQYRWTLGFSADDAGIGDLDQRNVVAVNPNTWPTPLDAFFQQEYPGVRYYAIQAATPDDLKQQLMNFKLG